MLGLRAVNSQLSARLPFASYSYGLANPRRLGASLSHQLTPLLGAFITSRLAARGWRFACMCFAGAAAAFTAIWQLLGTSSPVPLGAPPSDSGAKTATSGAKTATKPKKAVE